MKLVINDKEYTVCDSCGCFKSSERCYNCNPIKIGDLDVCDQLREYYGIPAKSCHKDIHRTPDLYETNTTHTKEENYGRTSGLGSNPYTSFKKYDPDVYTKHHLLEYFFTAKQLISMGLYNNSPEWQLLTVRKSYHYRIINGKKLHLHKLKNEYEKYKNMTEQQIKELINDIPKDIIKLFKAD